MQKLRITGWESNCCGGLMDRDEGLCPICFEGCGTIPVIEGDNQEAAMAIMEGWDKMPEWVHTWTEEILNERT